MWKNGRVDETTALPLVLRSLPLVLHSTVQCLSVRHFTACQVRPSTACQVRRSTASTFGQSTAKIDSSLHFDGPGALSDCAARLALLSYTQMEAEELGSLPPSQQPQAEAADTVEGGPGLIIVYAHDEVIHDALGPPSPREPPLVNLQRFSSNLFFK